MRKLAVLLLPLAAAFGCGSAVPSASRAGAITSSHQPIINGTRDTGDPAVVELLYVSGQGMEWCTGELIAPHTVMTAGHCTAKSEVGSQPLCTSASCAQNVWNQSDSTHLAIFVIFNNHCTSTNNNSMPCESGLISNGDYIVADKMVNPGYDGNVQPPYTASNNDNDIGLLHLSATTLQNGQAEPPLLQVNTQDLGSPCTDLGSLKFVGYGITSSSQDATAGIKYTVTHDVKVKDNWHDEEDGSGATQWGATCGNGSGSEPTCSGDSGGPSFDAQGRIVAVTSLGDQSCQAYGEDVRVDAYVSWINSTIKASTWGDAQGVNSGAGTSSTTSTGGTSGATSTGGTTSGGTTSGGTTSGGTTGAGSCDTCQTDAQSGACSSQTSACENDSNCTGLVDCMNNCSDDTCVQGCASQAGQTAVNEYQAFADCICNSACTQACSAECGGSGSSSGSTTGGATGTSGSPGTTTTTGGGSGSTAGGTTGTSGGPGTTTTTGGGTGTGGGSGSSGASGPRATCQACTSDASCPNSASNCIGPSGASQGLCEGTCSSDADCGAGFSCQSAGTASFCYPASNATCSEGGSNAPSSGPTVTEPPASSSSGAGIRPGAGGGCGSAGGGDLGFALLGVLPLVRRRRR